MAKSSSEIIQELKDHVYLEGSDYGEWYIGVAKDPKKQIFDVHKVVQDKHWYFMAEASSSEEAQAVESHYRQAKMDGGTKEEGATHVYAYRKREDTKP